MKEKIKKWFTLGLWTAEMVRTAARKGVLSSDEVKEILDENKILWEEQK